MFLYEYGVVWEDKGREEKTREGNGLGRLKEIWVSRVRRRRDMSFDSPFTRTNKQTNKRTPLDFPITVIERIQS